MSTEKRLTEVLKSSDEISFDDASKIIFFSDCHRGDNSWADDFAHNQNLFFFALNTYNETGFTYIELGDGDELWENKRFSEIRRAHKHIFRLLSAFYEDNRLHLIYGNHDIERKKQEVVEKTLFSYYDYRLKKKRDLFPGIKIPEGLILKHAQTGNRIFLTHGHQGDFWSDKHWRFSRFTVRHVWKSLQLRGFKDPTSPAQNFRKQEKVHNLILKWAQKTNQMIICGHTHRSVFPNVGDPPYFNTGSCVHPRCITGIEIENGSISLIKWWVKIKENGCLCVEKEILAGPQKLQDYFS